MAPLLFQSRELTALEIAAVPLSERGGGWGGLRTVKYLECYRAELTQDNSAPEPVSSLALKIKSEN